MTDEELAKELNISIEEVKKLSDEHRESLASMIDIANRWNAGLPIPKNVMLD
ncbi:hypothetical protein [Caulobacter phage Cr30]|uniref:hypothetical protein n=1 Tax=Caulobacter phage Cr30 TaxID=1357714 RepID=UPI0004A9B7F2|nr:hypothetical protein OZ74_gp083 [Caulobacter phage Cr30]AGS80968.1 hypothetical protein [Caulobacter phage Cr30]